MQFHLIRDLARVIVECHGNLVERTIHFWGAGNRVWCVEERQEMCQRKMTIDLGLGGRFASLVIRGNVKSSSHSI